MTRCLDEGPKVWAYVWTSCTKVDMSTRNGFYRAGVLSFFTSEKDFNPK